MPLPADRNRYFAAGLPAIVNPPSGAWAVTRVPVATLSCSQFDTGPPTTRFTVIEIRCGPRRRRGDRVAASELLAVDIELERDELARVEAECEFPGWLEVEALDVMGDVKDPAAYQDRLLLLTPDFRCPRWRNKPDKASAANPSSLAAVAACEPAFTTVVFEEPSSRNDGSSRAHALRCSCRRPMYQFTNASTSSSTKE